MSKSIEYRWQLVLPLTHPFIFGTNWPGFWAIVQEMLVDGNAPGVRQCEMCAVLVGVADSDCPGHNFVMNSSHIMQMIRD